MSFYVIALKGWFEIRKSLKPPKRVESFAYILKDTKTYARNEQGGIKFDSLHRIVYKKAKQKVKLTVVDYEGGQKVAMLKPAEVSGVVGGWHRMQPGDMRELTQVEVGRLKAFVT